MATQYQAFGNASREIDVWGHLRSTKRAALAQVLQSEAARRSVQTALMANIATYYQLLAGGVRGTRIACVAARLGIAKKTLCRHFPTKAALLQAVFQWYQQQVQAQHRRCQAAPTAPEELLLLSWLGEQHQPGFVAEIRRVVPERYQAWRAYLLALPEANLSRGQAAGVYRTRLDKPVR